MIIWRARGIQSHPILNSLRIIPDWPHDDQDDPRWCQDDPRWCQDVCPIFNSKTIFGNYSAKGIFLDHLRVCQMPLLLLHSEVIWHTLYFILPIQANSNFIFLESVLIFSNSSNMLNFSGVIFRKMKIVNYLKHNLWLNRVLTQWFFFLFLLISNICPQKFKITLCRLDLCWGCISFQEQKNTKMLKNTQAK